MKVLREQPKIFAYDCTDYSKFQIQLVDIDGEYVLYIYADKPLELHKVKIYPLSCGDWYFVDNRYKKHNRLGNFMRA